MNFLHFQVQIFEVINTIFTNFSCKLTNISILSSPSKKGTSGQPIFTSNWRTFWRTIIKLEDMEDTYFPHCLKKGTSGEPI